MILKNTLILIAVLFGLNLKAANITSINSGTWYSASTWDIGRVPACGDFVTVSAGHTITLDAQVNLDEASGCSAATFIMVRGTIFFDNGLKIRLACGSGVEVADGGMLQPDVGGGSNNLLEICKKVEWKASDGPVPGPEVFGTPLPLASELKSFHAKKVDRNYQLTWVIMSAYNIREYKVYQSNDGKNWTGIRTIESIGNHDSEYSYQILKSADNDNLVYFKLSEVDFDGNEKALSTISLSNEDGEIRVYPNPVTNGERMEVFYQSDRKETGELKIFNALGQITNKYILSIEEGSNSYQIDVSTLNSGVYFIQMDKNKQIYRLIISK